MGTLVGIGSGNRGHRITERGLFLAHMDIIAQKSRCDREGVERH